VISDQESRVDVRPKGNGPVVLGLHRERQARGAAPQKDQHRLQLHDNPRLRVLPRTQHGAPPSIGTNSLLSTAHEMLYLSSL